MFLLVCDCLYSGTLYLHSVQGFICIYERKLYNAVYLEQTCLNKDATPNTLQRECIHVTFRCNDKTFGLLQITGSISFKTRGVYMTNLAISKSFRTMYANFYLHIQSSCQYVIVFTWEHCIAIVYTFSCAFMRESCTMQFMWRKRV